MRRVLVVAVVLLVALEVFVAYKVITNEPATASAPSEPSAEPSAAPVTSAAPTGPTGAIRLWIGEDGRLFRTWLGTCSQPRRAKLEISNDAGRSFDEVALPVLGDAEAGPFPETVRTVLSVQAEDDQNLSIIATDDSCRTGAWETEDGGTTWTAADVDGWHVNADGSEVGSTDNVTEPGCTAVRVVPLRDSPQNAKVLCSDGTIVGTNDDGAEWAVLGDLTGAADMTFTSLRDGLAVRQGNNCAVEVMDTADAGGGWDSIACVLEESDLEPESIAQRGDRVFVQVGGELHRSDDGGHEWFNAEEPIDG